MSNSQRAKRVHVPKSRGDWHARQLSSKELGQWQERMQQIIAGRTKRHYYGTIWMVPAVKVRKARKYLRKHAKAGVRDISPTKFAAAAAEHHSSFGDVLDVIRYYYSSGDERAELRRSQINRGE